MPRIAAPPPNFQATERRHSSSPPRDAPQDLPPVDERYRGIRTLQQLQHELLCTRNEERATSALRGFFEPRMDQKETCEKFVNDLELKFPQHANAIHTTRRLYDLRAPTVRTPQTQERAAPPPAARRRASPVAPVAEEPEVRSPTAPPQNEPPPPQPNGLPPYSERDPDPQLTMLLERRLATELNELGSLSGFCVPGDAGEGGRDENESRRFPSLQEGSSPTRERATNATRRFSSLGVSGERARDENAARRVSLPTPPAQERREARDRLARERRESRRERGEGGRRDRRESGHGHRRERGVDQRPSRGQQESARRSFNAVDLAPPRQTRRNNTAPVAPATGGLAARHRAGGAVAQASLSAAPVRRSPPPLPPRAPTLASPSAPAGSSPVSPTAEPAAPAAASGPPSPHTPIARLPEPSAPIQIQQPTPVAAEPVEPPAYEPLDPRQTTQSPPTNSLNVRPRRSLHSPSAPNAPPRLPPIDTLNTSPRRRDRATMGDLMSDIVPVAGLQGEEIHVPAAISPLGAEMNIPGSERYGERYARLAQRAQRDATQGGKLRSFVKRWSGGNGRQVMV